MVAQTANLNHGLSRGLLHLRNLSWKVCFDGIYTLETPQHRRLAFFLSVKYTPPCLVTHEAKSIASVSASGSFFSHARNPWRSPSSLQPSTLPSHTISPPPGHTFYIAADSSQSLEVLDNYFCPNLAYKPDQTPFISVADFNSSAGRFSSSASLNGCTSLGPPASSRKKKKKRKKRASPPNTKMPRS